MRQILCVLGILQIINDFCPHFTGMTQTLRWGKSHKHINSSLGSLEEEQSVIFTSSLLDCEIKTVKHVDQTAKLKHKGRKGEKKTINIPTKDRERVRRKTKKKLRIGVIRPKDAPLVIWKIVWGGGVSCIPIRPSMFKVMFHTHFQSQPHPHPHTGTASPPSISLLPTPPWTASASQPGPKTPHTIAAH